MPSRRAWAALALLGIALLLASTWNVAQALLTKGDYDIGNYSYVRVNATLDEYACYAVSDYTAVDFGSSPVVFNAVFSSDYISIHINKTLDPGTGYIFRLSGRACLLRATSYTETLTGQVDAYASVRLP